MCRLNLPQIEKFDQDVLMLVIDDSPYGTRVSIQIGTLHIDMAISLATEEERMKFKKKWERAEMASYLQMAGMQTKEPVIDLEEVKGTVHLTHNLSLGPFETATVSGLLKGPAKESAYYKRVNISVQPMSNHLNDDSKYCAVPGYTFLKPGSHRIHVMIKNLTARKVNINQGVKIAMMGAANIVPHMLAPQEVQVETYGEKDGESTKLLMKSASNVEDSRNTTVEGDKRSGSAEPPPQRGPIENEKPKLDRTPLKGEQLEKLYELTKLAEGTVHWTDKQQEDAKKLIEEYSFLFAMGNLDLGRTNLVKHHIELTDYTPIKDRY